VKIRVVKRDEIDDERWNECITNSINCRHQALTWHLDIVSPNWQGVVHEDYRAVMPLPTTRKFGIPMVLQPFLTQQLGVFSLENNSSTLNKAFFSFLRKSIPVLYNTFNNEVQGMSSGVRVKQLPNFELNLNKDLSLLEKNFSKNTKRNVIKAERFGLIVAEVQPDNSIFEFHYINLRFSFDNIKKLLFKQIIHQAFERGEGLIYTSTNKPGELLSIAFFIKYENRLTFIVSSSSSQGYKQYAMFPIFNDVIKRYAGQNVTLDFEGSQTGGVARFYKGFGGSEVPYYQLTNRSYRAYRRISTLKQMAPLM